MSDSAASAQRRLASIERQILPPSVSTSKGNGGVPRPRPPSLWSQFSPVSKVTIALVPPVVSWFLRCAAAGKKPSEVLTFLVSAYSQSVGLYGLKEMYDEIRRNLGVKMTQSRSYQVFQFAGSAVYTASLWSMIRTTVGKTFFGFNVLYTLAYGYFLYLSLVYNAGLPDPQPEKSLDSLQAAGPMNLPAMIGYAGSLGALALVWSREIKASLSGGSFNNLIAVAGFALSAFGVLKAGYSTARTSTPAITPLKGIVPLASAILLGVSSLIPLWRSDPVARIYLTGYGAMIYSLFMIAGFCAKQEAADARRRQ